MLPLSAELAAGFAFVCQSTAWLQMGFSLWLTPGYSQQQQPQNTDIHSTQIYINNKHYDLREREALLVLLAIKKHANMCAHLVNIKNSCTIIRR